MRDSGIARAAGRRVGACARVGRRAGLSMALSRCPGSVGRGAHAAAPVGLVVVGLVALGVGGELEEHLLEPVAAGLAQLDEGDAPPGRRRGRHARGRRRRAAGRRAAGRRRGRWCSGDADRTPAPARRRGASGRRRAHLRAGGGEQVVLRAVGDDAAAADDDEVVGDDLDLVQQVRREQDGAAAVGVRRAAGRASTGCRPGPARWPARRGSAPAGRRAARAAMPEPLPHAEGVVADAASGLLVGRARRARACRRRGSAGRPIVRTASVRISRPVRPACCAEASRRTPDLASGLGRSAKRRPDHVGGAGGRRGAGRRSRASSSTCRRRSGRGSR